MGLAAWRDYLTGLIIGLPWVILRPPISAALPTYRWDQIAGYRVDSSQALIRLLQHYANPLDQFELLGPVVSTGIGLFLFPFLAVVGLRAGLRSAGRSLPLLVYPWIYFAVFSALNPLIFPGI